MNLWAIIGGGESLKVEDIDRLRYRAKVICVNDAYRICPWGDYLYARDLDWWKSTPYGHSAPNHILARLSFDGYLLTGSALAASEFGIRHIDTVGPLGGLSASGAVHEGPPGAQNSGYQAIGIAVHNIVASGKPGKILLLGFDMGGRHWFGDHPAPLTNVKVNEYPMFARGFNSMVPDLSALGVEVVNCSPISAITCFRFGTVADEIRQIDPTLTESQPSRGE